MNIFFSEHGFDPTIIIDLKEFVNIIPLLNRDSVIFGGTYAKYNNAVEYFFDELKKCKVNLVFFLKDRINNNVDDSLQRSKRQADDKKRIYSAYDGLKMRYRKTVACFEAARDNKRFLYNLTKICSKYGELKVTFKSHNLNIAKYACRNADKVLSIICNDTTLLAVDGKFQYWSICDSVENMIFKLKGSRYCRHELNRELGLNSMQMRLFATITRCDKGVLFRFSKNLAPVGMIRFLKIAKYAREQHPIDEKNFNLEKIARDIYGSQYTKTCFDELDNIWKKQDLNYDLDIELNSTENTLIAHSDVGYSDVLRFCREKNHFSYKLMMEANNAVYLFNDLLYLDFRQNDSSKYNDSVYSVLMKLIGILHKDKSSDYRPEQKAVFNKRNNEDPGNVIQKEIIYPSCK